MGIHVPVLDKLKCSLFGIQLFDVIFCEIMHLTHSSHNHRISLGRVVCVAFLLCRVQRKFVLVHAPFHLIRVQIAVGVVQEIPRPAAK